MKTKIFEALIAVLIVVNLAFVALDLASAQGQTPVMMRTLVLEGDKLVFERDERKPRFFFFITHQGVYYTNTAEGAFFKLEDWNLIGAEHQRIIKEKLEELIEWEK